MLLAKRLRLVPREGAGVTPDEPRQPNYWPSGTSRGKPAHRGGKSEMEIYEPVSEQTQKSNIAEWNEAKSKYLYSFLIYIYEGINVYFIPRNGTVESLVAVK